MSNKLRILLVEGNLKANCDRAIAIGISTAAERYEMTLRMVDPDLEIDRVFAAEPDVDLPSGASISQYDGVVVGGSGLHAYHTEIAVTRQIEFMKAVFNVGVPVLGSCWGMQIAVLAAGGSVAPSPYGREVGIARKVALTQEGRGHDFFQGKASVFDTPCIHLDEVTHVPTGAVVLASNSHTRVQAVAFQAQKSEFWGIQYHPEFNLGHMASLGKLYMDMMIEGGNYTSKEDGEAFISLQNELQNNPDDAALAWKLGVDSDVLDDSIRIREVRNWIEYLIKTKK